MKETLKLFWHATAEDLRMIWDFLDNDSGKIVSKKGRKLLENGINWLDLRK